MTNTPFTTDAIEKIVRQAKRKSIGRTIISSTIAVIVLGTILIMCNGKIVNRAYNKAMQENQLLYKISQPNVKRNGVTFDYGILSGSYAYYKYKVIEDKVVPWGEEQQTFNVFGHNNPSTEFDNIRVGENEETYRNYNPINGQRSMLFYHPWFDYVTMENDLDLIHAAPDDAVMEVALSFDQPYSVDEVQAFFPLHKKISWYWANDYNQNDKKQLQGLHDSGNTATHVYGFLATTEVWEGSKPQTEQDYLRLVNELKNSGGYDHIVNRLLKSAKQNEKEGLILGVVITGTKEELLALEQDHHIRAISLGAVAREW
ncbi:anti sigma factor C-terminal domain-containing protein [Sporosarcina sp. NPDC096371]|uniref:anti sigma factor C-terminal domain-containing protein n=1 Tax=Sporosarcina sp. NPDC096371 TaxID=3364530 RepID=UPI003805F1F9